MGCPIGDERIRAAPIKPNTATKDTGNHDKQIHSPGLPNGLKGLQPRAPKAEGPKTKTKNSQNSRLSSQCSLFRSTPVENFVLLSTKLALQNKHFSAQSALKLTYRHLGFQKFIPGMTSRRERGRKRRGGEEAGKGPYQIVSPGPPQHVNPALQIHD